MLAIYAFYNYEIWQMDAKTAFLNGYLKEELYMMLLGIVVEIKIFYASPRSIYGETSNEREREGVYLHTLEDRDAEALQERSSRIRTRSDSDRGRF